jgi:DNA-binding FadR family transcriptional regulator
MLRTVQNHSLADQVFEQLFVEIVVGAYRPDSSLPAERALAETFGVNRHVVRAIAREMAETKDARALRTPKKPDETPAPSVEYYLD